MNNLNTVLIEGNLTRDPKEAEYAADYDLCKFPIANNRYYLKKNGEWQTETSYFIVEVYGSAAKACMKYLHKGRGVRVVGRLKFRKWTDNGTYRETVTIIAEHIEFQPERQKTRTSSVEDPFQAGSFQPNASQAAALPTDDSQAYAVQGEPMQQPDVGPEDFECTAETGEESSDTYEKQDPLCGRSGSADEDAGEGGVQVF